MKRLSIFLLITTWLLPFSLWAQPIVNKPIAAPKLVEVQITSEVQRAIEQSKDLRTPLEQKMTTAVLEVAKQYKVNGNTFQSRSPQVQSFSPIHSASLPKVDTKDRVYVYLRLAKGHTTREVLRVVTSNGGYADYSNDKFLLIQAWIPVSKLSKIASLKAIGTIDLIIPPGHGTGPVTSQGDSRLRSDVARSVMAANGAGIKVGVMSDDCGNAEGLVAPRITNGELGPGTTVLIDNKGGTRTHEGLAMMEIVQDVAPSSQIYFATASTGEGQMSTNINSLAAAGCRVITDDIIYFDEPVFEDGSISQTVNNVASVNNVVYTSSSTNVGNSNYFGTYSPSGANQPVGNSGNFNVHLFSGATYTNQFTFPGGANLFFVLHWDDQYGASGNDYDIYCVDQFNTTTFASSTNTQNGTQNPNEVLSMSNAGGNTICNLIIVRKAVSGGDPNPNARLKLAIWQGIPLQFATAATSTWGHSTALSCLGAGAIDAQVNNYNTIEPFSSQGPTYMVQFGVGLSGGNRPLLSTRLKPDVTSFDGVATSVPGFGNFHGTSAATPHVAGLAAQLLSL